MRRSMLVCLRYGASGAKADPGWAMFSAASPPAEKGYEAHSRGLSKVAQQFSNTHRWVYLALAHLGMLCSFLHSPIFGLSFLGRGLMGPEWHHSVGGQMKTFCVLRFACISYIGCLMNNKVAFYVQLRHAILPTSLC